MMMKRQQILLDSYFLEEQWFVPKIGYQEYWYCQKKLFHYSCNSKNSSYIGSKEELDFEKFSTKRRYLAQCPTALSKKSFVELVECIRTCCYWREVVDCYFGMKYRLFLWCLKLKHSCSFFLGFFDVDS